MNQRDSRGDEAGKADLSNTIARAVWSCTAETRTRDQPRFESTARIFLIALNKDLNRAWQRQLLTDDNVKI